jgi:hypothetical protein
MFLQFFYKIIYVHIFTEYLIAPYGVTNYIYIYIYIYIKGPEKTTRGGEWESIKYSLWGDSGYIPKLIQCLSLLTRPKSHNYEKTISPQNRVSNRSGNTNRCSLEHVRDWRQKSDQNLIHVFTIISPNNLQTRSKNHRERTIKTKKSGAF